MTKKTLLNLWLLLVCFVVGGSSAWGAGETTISVGSSSLLWTAYENDYTAESGVFTLRYEKGSYSNSISGGIQSAELRLYSGTNFVISSTQTITKIVYNVADGSGKNYSVSALSTNDGYLTNGTWTGSSTSISASLSAQNRIKSVTITYETGTDQSLEENDLVLTKSSLSFDLYNNSSAQVINYSTSSTGTVSIAKSDYANFAIDAENKTITVTPVKKTSEAVEITVNQAADGTYAAGSGTFTVTITDSTPKTGSWVATTLADLTADDIFVIVGTYSNGSYAMTNDSGTSSAPGATHVTVKDNEITCDIADNMKWNISGNSTDGYTFYPNGDAENWLYCTNTNNGVRVGKNDNKTFEIKGNYLYHKETSRYVGIYSSQDWRCYTSINSNITDQTFAFYKYESNAAVKNPIITVDETFVGSTTATITCATDGATIYYSYDNENWTEYTAALTITATTTIYAKATKGEDESSVVSKTTTKVLPTPTVTVTGDLTLDLNGETDVEAGTLTAAVTYEEAAVAGAIVTWTSSNADVATINAETGAVTIKTTGTVTFIATYAGNSDYAEATGTKNVTVINSKAPGSEAIPYTVAQAIEATPASGTSEKVYIHGIVSGFYGDDIVSDGANYRYYISDDGTTTKQLLVYRGKGLNEQTFANASDLEIGDEVVIYGGLTTYKSEAEVASGNYLISRTEKPASDLTKTSDITLDYKNGATDADLTEYFTTSSTGTITYTVADETVIERADEQISALKVGTTTVTVSQAATLSYKAGEITINVTVQDTREAATTIPAINISTLKVGNEGTLSVTDPEKADEGVTFSYTSSNEEVLHIDGAEYAALTVGTATITATATPSNANLYKPVVANFEVTVEADVKTDTEIALDEENGSTVYGTQKSVDFLITDGYDGELSYIIDNAAIADVEIGADAITFIPRAIGTAVISISAPATANFNAAEDVQYTLTVTAPEGSAIAAESGFVKVTATKDITDGEYLIVNETAAVAFDGSLKELDKVSDVINVEINENRIAANATTTASTFTIDVANGTLQSKSGMYIGVSSNSNGLKQTDTEDTYTNSFAISEGNAIISAVFEESTMSLRYNKASDQNRFRYYKNNGQEAIQLYKLAGADITAKLNASGYATFCSQYPLDFTDAEGYTAWQITNITSNVITFEKINGSIKGGQGILLKGESGATVTLNSVASSNELGNNMLKGTLAPMYVAADTYYGLSGDSFVKVGAGTVPAGKALLDASWISTSPSRLSFVFNDDTTTGINAVNNEQTENGAVYNLNGQRVETMKKGGLYIQNGKKFINK